jgi:hypothetical protein
VVREGLGHAYVVLRLIPTADWFAQATGDRSREVCLDALEQGVSKVLVAGL